MLDNPRSPDDHRVRTAAVRRQKTYRQLLETAVSLLLSVKGDPPSIEDLIRAAGVSRGTFYNYFSTTTEVVDAIVGVLSDDIVKGVDPMLRTLENSAERISIGARLYLSICAHHPHVGHFIALASPKNGAMGKLAERYLIRDLSSGQAQGLFNFKNLVAAMDLLIGTSAQSMDSLVSGHTTFEGAVASLEMALIGLGVSAPEAARLCTMQLPELVAMEGSLLEYLIRTRR